MKVVGCDVGSLYTKAVLLDGDEVVNSKLVKSTANLVNEIDGFLKTLQKEAGISKVDCIVATGSGAEIVKNADLIESTITCCGAGVAFYFPEVSFSIDIGGHSVTVLNINEDGEVVNFLRNDKCASGSGRFLEIIAEKLNIRVEEIDSIMHNFTRAVEISAQCGVFALSEVITHLNRGERVPNIIAGVCESIADTVLSLAGRLRFDGYYTVTGGVALVESIMRIIKEKLKGSYKKFPKNPQFAAAIGAAVLGGSG